MQKLSKLKGSQTGRLIKEAHLLSQALKTLVKSLDDGSGTEEALTDAKNTLHQLGYKLDG